jgi:2,7-dihydroxy-5-methyl-1-naphthoate 7-O-methyltransferase
MTEEWGGGLWAAADLATPMAIRVAATLRLADHVAAGTVGTLGVDPDALERLMAHLVTAGILTRDGDYRLTALGEQLRDDHPAGIRAFLDQTGAIGRADLSYFHLLDSVRTGEAAYPRQYGRGFWDDLDADPALAASFDALMGDRLTGELPALLAAYPWGDLGHVVDVGGGDGRLLVAVLRAHGGLRGTVLDRPGPVALAAAAISAAGLDRRAEAVRGNFFDPLPAGAGGYVLSGVLKDWGDDDALRILRRCAEAAGRTGRVLVIDEEGGRYTSGDLQMLCYTGGRERTAAQLADLAARAGLTVGTVTPAGLRMITELRG